MKANLMLKRSLCLLSLALSMTCAAYAQTTDAPKKDNLSLDSLMVDEPKLPEKIKIDPALLVPPENASVDDLFKFVEELQDKLPQPQSQDDIYQIVDAVSKAYLNVADLLLGKELDAEQKERAIQLKVVALTTRANVDPEAAKTLDEFVDENLKAAKTEAELIKAYQLKLQTLDARNAELSQMIALADEMYARPEEELQVFAIEVKAQAFITSFQKEGTVDEELVKSIDSVIEDKDRSQKVREKAYEMKLVASIILAELEREKEADQQDATKFEEVEKLFELLTSDAFSADLKKTVYQLRVQMLLDPNSTDEQAEEKIQKTVEKLLEEEDSELYALGVAVKGQTLINKAQASPENVQELVKYAEEIYQLSKEKEELKTQAIGLKIQAHRFQQDPEGLLKFVDEQLAAKPDEDLVNKLNQVKISVVTELVNKNPESFDAYKDFLTTLGKDDAFAGPVSQAYIARFLGALTKASETKGDLSAYDAAVAQFKQDLLAAPRAISAPPPSPGGSRRRTRGASFS